MKKVLLTAAAVLSLSAFPLSKAADAQEATVSFEVMKLETAQRVAQAALDTCRGAGFQVAVSVVDRFGNPQVLLRDRFAGTHTHDTAYRKAWTAVSFRTDTVELAKLTAAGTDFSGIRFVTNALAVGGGVSVLDGEGSIVGGIGISGAPSGADDHMCAQAGIEAVADDLAF